ncbi:NAD-dependent epimerase/dehydratase family protein [Enterococcus sp. 5B3_DIV0040]|uniref:NAD-dependent epimerase/dehydratase family protein n=1 Tax=Enterococcus sp. 5B3_DIV0040 TaxID=1834182 RepID=UPI0034E8A809
MGIDNMNGYYSVQLKEDRLKSIVSRRFTFFKADLNDKEKLEEIFMNQNIDIVINLAAQAGVRYSLENPDAYISSNISGFLNILELSVKYNIKHLVYASSSSVYGGNKHVPFSTEDSVDHPVSIYAATKKTNELFAHTYSHLYNLPTTGLRFFTVYGPYGRPDMAYYSFTKNILNNKEITVYNYGQMERDFTYIDDIVTAIEKIIFMTPKANNKWSEIDGKVSESWAPYKIYNIGNNNPVKLMDFIRIIENKLGIKANIKFEKMQPGDVLKTYADISDLSSCIDFYPNTPIEEGLESFVNWYKKYYDLN